MLVRGLAIAVVVLATLATPTQDLPTASASNANPQQVPGLRLRVGDSIDDLDFTIGDDGALTLVWLASLYDDPNDHSRVRTEVWVSRRERKGSGLESSCETEFLSRLACFGATDGTALQSDRSGAVS